MGLLILRLLRLDDDSGLRLLHRHGGLLLLRRIDGSFVAGHAEGDETARPDPGDADGDDSDEFLPNGPGLLRWLDHDGGRLLLLIDHLSDWLDGLLRLVYHLRLHHLWL